jgi:hypothetical protein
VSALLHVPNPWASEAEAVQVSEDHDDLIPAVEGEPRPNGYIGVVDQLGYRWWMSHDVLKRRQPTTPLSAEQIQRIRALKEILAEQDRTSLEQAVENFGRDAHPEPEIRLWERIARVYQEELRERPGADQTERRLLFAAVLTCSFGASDATDAIAIDEKLARLPDLARVVTRFRGSGSGLRRAQRAHGFLRQLRR